MRTIYLLTTGLLATLACVVAKAQTGNLSSTIDSLANFNQQECTDFFLAHHTNPNDLPEFLGASQRNYIRKTFFSSSARPSAPNPIPQQACTNIDFESGTLNGWNTSTGFNPGFNIAGCCQNAGGAQLIMNAGNDGCGGFPVVAAGGNFSVRLGDNGTGGIADRLEQTFNVTTTNANFTYRYAVVFEDPGHALADQPSFQIEMLDSNGLQIPCTYYNVAAGQNIPGFINSATCNNVVYKPWTNVSVDLTAYVGQNVTIRFTTYDCALGGHYAYAYIDGSCSNFNITQSGILCQGSTIQLTPPSGFASYNWQLPDNSVQTTQVLTTGMPGVYTLNLVTFTGCPGPTLTYTLTDFPKPNAVFVQNQLSACSHTLNFTNNSTVSSGNITTNNWDLGDGNTGTTLNASHTYANTGSYNVQLICTTNMGCKDTALVPVTISPLPNVSFSNNTVCLNTITSFTNTSTVSSGNIVATNWTFGNGNTSALVQPTQQYLSAGTYPVTLSVTTNNNCTNSVTQQVLINPLPNVSFTANGVCEGQAVNYANTSYITGGTITNYIWDFTTDGTPDNITISPNNLFASPGTYNTQLMVVSNNNCSATYSLAVNVYPKPVMQFAAAPVCVGIATTFTNQSSISSGQIATYNWNFGDALTGSVANPQHNYATYGIYNVLLTATSNNNCTNTLLQSVQVYPKPAVNFSSSIACLNQATQFNNQSSIVAGNITSWQWDFDNNGTIDNTAANPSYVYPNAGNAQSRLIAVSNNNCSSQTINTVIVHFNPVANFYVPSACMPQTSSFHDASISNDGAITSYNWDFNGDNLPDNIQQNPSYNFAQAGNYGVKLEIQTQYGCTNTITKSAYVNATPTALFTAQNNMGCPSLCVNFINNSTIGNGAINTYQWIFGDNTVPNYSQNPTHCYSSGNYGVTLKAVSDSGCVGVSTIPNFVQVYPTPIAGFNITPSEVDITTPLIEVTDQSTGANSVVYLFSDGTVKNTPNFSHLFNTDGAKTVGILQVVTNAYSCKDSIIRNVTIKPSYVIYVPNAFTPNSDGVNDGFKALGVGIEAFKMQIFDRWGKMIFETDDIDNAWDGSVGRGNESDAKQEVYVWKVKVKDVNHNDHDLIGHVTLLK
ncbi:MAG: PKD domain-containing protein [Bacteroidota bacterium]